MSIETAYSAHQLWLTFELQIDGYPVRYYSDQAPAAVSGFSQARAIMDVSDSESRLNLIEGIAETGSVVVDLLYNDDTAGLLRLGQRGATFSTYLTAETPSQATGAAGTVTVEDVGSIGVGATVWVGQEAMLVTGVAAPDISVTRGHLLSETQWHRVDNATQTRPILTAECVSFRSRRCRLVAYEVYGDGRVAPQGIDIISGFVDETPRLSRDGLTIEVSIAPDSARLSQQLPSEQAAAVAARLVQGEHYFTGTAQGATVALQVPGNHAIDTRASTAVVAGVFSPGRNAAEHDANADTLNAMFDPAFGVDDDRSGRLDFQNNDGLHAITAIDTVADKVTCGTLALAGKFRRFSNTRLKHRRRVDWYDGTGGVLERWPDVLLSAWNAATAMRPSTTASPDGSFADVALEPGSVRVILNARFDSVVVTLPGGYDAHGVHYIQWGSEPGGEPDPDGLRVIVATPTDDDGGLVGEALPIDGIATGFYHSGETDLLLTEDIAGSSGTLPAWVRIDAYVPEHGEVRTQLVQVSAIATQALSSGATGYRYTIVEGTAIMVEGDDLLGALARPASRFPATFGDFAFLTPDERASVTPILMTGESADLPGTVLNILQSRYGDGSRGTADVLTDGIGLTDSQLDPASFARATTPPGLDQTAFIFEGAASAADVLGPMLRAAGYALTPRLSLANGLRRLSLVPMRRASAVQSRLALTRADFVAEPSISSITDDELVNRIVYRAPGDDRLRVEFRDVDSIGRNGERKTQAEDLIGFVPSGDTIGQAVATMQPIALARFALVGSPRRVLRGSVRLGLGLLLDPGDVVTLTHSDALGYTGARGLTAAPALVVAVRRDFGSRTAQVDLVYHAANLSGFAPSLLVTDHTISATTVDVAANGYTEAASPTTGAAQTDLTYWQAGDVCLVVSDPLGAGWPTGYELTVDSVDAAANRITFTGAHAGTGLTTGSVLRPASYASASAAHQAFAFLSDGDEVVAGVATYEHD